MRGTSNKSSIAYRRDVLPSILASLAARSYFTLNGVDQWISTPYTGNLDIISDVEMAGKVSISLGGNQTIMSGWSGNSGYMMSVNTLSNVAARHGDGSVDRFGTSNPLTVPDGVVVNLGAQFDVNAGDWLFGIDGATQAHALGLPGSGLASGIEFTIGANAGGAAGFMSGDVYSAQVRNGVGGPLVVDMSAADSGLPSGVVTDGTTWVGADGRTYTAHGGLSYFEGGD